MADIYDRKKRKTRPPVEAPLESYIRERTHYSACAVNEYWYISIHYPKKTHIQRYLNKRFYTLEQAVDFLRPIIAEHGFPPKQKYRKVSPSYSANAMDIKSINQRRDLMLSQHTDPSLLETPPHDADTEEEACAGIESLLTAV
jgi:hypothetical protein